MFEHSCPETSFLTILSNLHENILRAVFMYLVHVPVNIASKKSVEIFFNKSLTMITISILLSQHRP